MKTNPSPKIFKFAFFAALSIALASATQSLKAQTADNLLVLTEHSPTSLTFTYNGLSDPTTGVTVTPVSPDHWTVTIAQGSSPSIILNWAEPESPSSTWNNVSGQVSLFGVFSDTNTFGAGIQVNEDGHVYTNVGTDTSNGRPIDIKFVDEAAVAEGSRVPDTGSTFGLLAVALAGLFGASRFRSLRLA